MKIRKIDRKPSGNIPQESRAHSQNRVLLVCFLVWCAGVIFSYAAGAEVCTFKSYTGLPCPGCGMTRAAVALLKGDISGSIIFNPMLLPAAAVVLAFVTEKIILRRKTSYSLVLFLVFMILMFAVYLLRMILYFPDGPEPMTWEPDPLILRLIITDIS